MPYLPWLFCGHVEYVENPLKLFILVENPVETVENLLFLSRNYSL